MNELFQSEEMARRILQNQRTILEQNSKILALQETLKNQDVQNNKEVVPAIVKRTVRAVVRSHPQQWNIAFSFRAPANESINKILMQNIKALNGMDKFPDNVIARSLRAYFQSRRRRKQNINDGSHEKNLQRERRRQRVAAKLKRRKSALNLSSTWSDREKADIKMGLVLKSMSPENSEDDVQESGSDDSEAEPDQPKKKTIVTSPLSWRSVQFKDTIQSLDRKWMRRCSERSRTMVKKEKSWSRNSCACPRRCATLDAEEAG